MRYCLPICLGLLGFSVAALATSPSTRHHLDIINHSGADIVTIYFTPQFATTIPVNALPHHQPLLDGQTYHMPTSAHLSVCRWDWVIHYRNDKLPHLIGYLNACKVHSLTLSYNDKTHQTEATTQ
jgi:hypothetical protein